MGIDAVLFAKIKNQSNSYQRIGTGLRLYYYSASEKLSFIGSKSYNPEALIDDSSINWTTPQNAIIQLQESILYHNEQETDNSIQFTVDALTYLLETVENKKDIWEYLVLEGDSGGIVQDILDFDLFNTHSKFDYIRD